MGDRSRHERKSSARVDAGHRRQRRRVVHRDRRHARAADAHRDPDRRSRFVRPRPLEPAEGYRNVTPYPIRLRYLHALIIDPRNNLPILYSWSLDNIGGASAGARGVGRRARPAWIDTEAGTRLGRLLRRRLLRRVRQAGARRHHGRRARRSRRSESRSTPSRRWPTRAATRSPRRCARNTSTRRIARELRKSVVLKADGQDFILKPIYNVSRPAGEPLFEYLLELAMPDGTIHTGTTWIAELMPCAC